MPNENPNPAPAAAPLPTYGASEQGLICAYRFDAGGQASALGQVPSPQALAEAPPGFVWLHVNLSHAGALQTLRQAGVLDDELLAAMQQGSRATRIERQGETLFAVVNDVTFDFSFDPDDIATLWVHVRPGCVLSARRQPLRSVDRLRMAVKRGEGLRSPIALLDHLLQDQADELQAIVRRTADRIDDIEDELLRGRHARHAVEVAHLRRVLVRLQRLLAPEPSALARTLAHPPAWATDEDRAQLQRASEEFALVLRDAAALQERIKLMQDETAARQAEENNRSLFTLTVVTVLALPINLVSGLLGMNVGGIPLSDHGQGFWIMLALIAALTGLATVLVRRQVRGARDGA